MCSVWRCWRFVTRVGTVRFMFSFLPPDARVEVCSSCAELAECGTGCEKGAGSGTSRASFFLPDVVTPTLILRSLITARISSPSPLFARQGDASTRVVVRLWA